MNPHTKEYPRTYDLDLEVLGEILKYRGVGNFFKMVGAVVKKFVNFDV